MQIVSSNRIMFSNLPIPDLTVLVNIMEWILLKMPDIIVHFLTVQRVSASII